MSAVQITTPPYPHLSPLEWTRLSALRAREERAAALSNADAPSRRVWFDRDLVLTVLNLVAIVGATVAAARSTFPS